MTLRFPRAALDDIMAHARAGLPNEVCGLFSGKRGSDDRIDVHASYRVDNVHPRPRGEFLLDPKEQLRLTLEIEDEQGLEVLGYYHSHPVGPPRLSATDAARASHPGAVYFLVWLAPEEGYGAWAWDATARRFRALAVEITDDAAESAPDVAAWQDRAAFFVTPATQTVHRASALTAGCARDLADGPVQDVEDEAKATLVLKTRHFSPCSRCWG